MRMFFSVFMYLFYSYQHVLLCTLLTILPSGMYTDIVNCDIKNTTVHFVQIIKVFIYLFIYLYVIFTQDIPSVRYTVRPGVPTIIQYMIHT